MRTVPHGFVARPWTSAQLALVAEEQGLALSPAAATADGALDDAFWATLSPDEVQRVKAAWAASCSRPVASFDRATLERRWAILHPIMQPAAP
eukprot:7380767-Prymnesium_polylepis.1